MAGGSDFLESFSWTDVDDKTPVKPNCCSFKLKEIGFVNKRFFFFLNNLPELGQLFIHVSDLYANLRLALLLAVPSH